jgi:hypothetical protein
MNSLFLVVMTHRVRFLALRGNPYSYVNGNRIEMLSCLCRLRSEEEPKAGADRLVEKFDKDKERDKSSSTSSANTSSSSEVKDKPAAADKQAEESAVPAGQSKPRKIVR